MEMAPHDEKSSEQVPLSWRNWLNVGAYAVNAFITFSSQAGLYGPDNTVLSKKYQTLVTPKGTAFSIWGVIFILEAVFCLVQLLPRYRGSKLVEAITPWWAASCAFQVAWTPTFAQEVMWLQEIWMGCILVSLMGLLWNADAVGKYSCLEYLGLRLCFGVHCGWICCAFAVGANTWAVSAGATQSELLGLAIASLASVLIVATLWSAAVPHPEPCIALVAAWATYWIYSDLNAGAELLLDNTRENFLEWDANTIGGVRNAAGYSSLIALVLTAVAVVVRLRAEWTREGPSVKEESETDSLKVELAPTPAPAMGA